jgi:hypothetical protein
MTHPMPPLPHAAVVVPDRHCPAEQHPEHDVGSHTQAPLAQWSPLAQLPVAHVPPHPSFAPHAALAQFGVHPQTPACPPPPHDSGVLHMLPAQQGCPLPPHASQLALLHVCALAQTAHVTPA